MSRKLLVVGLALLSAAAMVPSATAVADGPSLSPAGKASFPDRSYVLTLPERARLERGDVRVRENGGPVRALRVAPLGASRRSRLGVVLAVDSSASMRGAPLRGAFAAARGFSRTRNPQQPLALVSFGSSARVEMSFTTDQFKIRRTLARPSPASGGTHLYDAGLRGVELIGQAGLPGGFLVLMTDGTDHGSITNAKALSAAARQAHVRIYAVGLRSSRFDPAAPRRLAASTGGAYSEASSPEELERIFRALGAELSNGYMLRYHSLAGPHKRVDVRASVDGFGSASTAYTSPHLRPAPLRPRRGKAAGARHSPPSSLRSSSPSYSGSLRWPSCGAGGRPRVSEWPSSWLRIRGMRPPGPSPGGSRPVPSIRCRGSAGGMTSRRKSTSPSSAGPLPSWF